MSVREFDDIVEKFFKFPAELIRLFDKVFFTAGESCLEKKRVFFHNPGKEEMAFQ